MDTTELSQRLFDAALGGIDMWSVYVGENLGLYAALAQRGSLTGAELAASAQIHPRYAIEWLEQQAVTGILEVNDADLPGDQRRYALPEAHAEVLTDPDSLNYVAPFMRLMTAAGMQLSALLEAYRTGGGVGWPQYGPDMRTGQAEMNRPWFLGALGTDWFPAVPDLDQRLRDGARVADIGCGEGWSSIAMALAYPAAAVDGYDLDEPSVQAARAHAEQAGVSGRVRYFAGDAAATDRDGAYDVVTAFECIHDLANPVDVLATMRRLVKPDGQVIVMDERVAERFPGRGDDIERLMYGFSLFVCLPDGLSHSPSAGTGTVMRPDTLRRYAEQAGFSGLEVLPIENDLWRFYRLSQAAPAGG
ncbi:MAG: class I SAM-dependent methyltransferase [Geodermatophilaceae bacterium]|nr:class I SAM-dependent methyltransferase [Geodermatophilaceae bacterium]